MLQIDYMWFNSDQGSRNKMQVLRKHVMFNDVFCSNKQQFYYNSNPFIIYKFALKICLNNNKFTEKYQVGLYINLFD